MSTIAMAVSMIASLIFIVTTGVAIFKSGQRRERNQRQAEDERIKDLAAEVAAAVVSPVVEEMRQMRRLFADLVKIARDDRAKLLEQLAPPSRRTGW